VPAAPVNPFFAATAAHLLRRLLIGLSRPEGVRFNVYRTA